MSSHDARPWEPSNDGPTPGTGPGPRNLALVSRDAERALTRQRLLGWAAGDTAMTAGVQLLCQAFHGRFAHPDQPWVRTEPDGYTWLDTAALHSSLDVLSGGERRLLTLVCALTAARPVLVDLTDLITGLDRDHLDLTLAALAHAAGSHQHSQFVLDPDGNPHFHPTTTLHPWPAAHTPPPPAPPYTAQPTGLSPTL